MIRSWPLLFILIPLVELYFIIVVGDMIGALWTVLLVLMTAVIGVNLLRLQGMSTLGRAQRNMAQGQVPAMEMMEGVALAVAGILLITPGFITDSIGFLLLLPVTRRAIIQYLMRRATVFANMHGGPGGQGGFQSSTYYEHSSTARGKGSSDTEKKTDRVGHTIDGEYTRED
jgi:UPF0716 protein FxsA